MGLLTLGCQVDIFVPIFFFLGSEKESSVSNENCTVQCTGGSESAQQVCKEV